MSAQNLLKIIECPNLVNKLKDLVEKQHLLNLAMEVHKQEKSFIAIEFKKIGLKQKEFNDIVKFIKNEELLMNELTFIEAINDHLISV